MATETTIFQASDLNRRGRAILDTARGGLARIRDTDGASLVLTREDVYESLREQVAALRRLADATASFITIDRALDHEHRAPSLAELGSWTWVRHLPPEDATEFVQDIAEALYASCREMSSVPLAAALDDWRATAEALSDPLARQTLLGSSSGEDYVEVARPERSIEDAPAADAAAPISGS